VISVPRLRERFALVLLTLLFVASVDRAKSLSISMDEAYTYLSFVAPPLSRILTTYSPNHHVLYSLLAKASVQVFGVSELSLRVPALLGCILCLGAILQVSRALFGTGWMMLLSICLVAMNPLIFDYMSQARGYGLALGFYLFGVLFSVQVLLLRHPGRNNSWLAGAGVLLGLSLAANIAFGIPVAALDLLFMAAAAWSFPGRCWKTGWWLFVPELAVFGAIAGSPIIHADTKEFIGGFTSIFQTLNNFAISCVIHDWDGNGVWTSQVNVWTSEWLYPAFRITFLIVLGTVVVLFAIRLWDRMVSDSGPGIERRANDLWLFVFGISLVLAVMMLIVAHSVAGAPYPFARFVMYCWPLMAFTICLLIERLRVGRMPARILSALFLLFCLAMTIQSGLQFDLDHFGWLEYSAGTRQVADFIRRRQTQSEHQVNIVTSGSLYACLDYYRSAYSMRQWQLGVLSDSPPAGDYLVIDVFDARKGIPEGYRQIWRDPLSKAVIAIPRTAS
jgi:hypothetical protein